MEYGRGDLRRRRAVAVDFRDAKLTIDQLIAGNIEGSNASLRRVGGQRTRGGGQCCFPTPV
jgi:hypothetical protein